MTTILSMPARKPAPQTDDGKPGRRIEWVGEKSIMDEPFVWVGLATGKFTREQEALLRRTALNRCARIDTAERVMDEHDPGLSRRYAWTPRNRWTVVMTYADADRLLSCASGHEFRDLDAAEEGEPATLSYPPLEIRLVERSVLSETGIELAEQIG